MTTYIHELLCLDGSGNLSVAHLTVVDDDIYLASQEADAVYTLDGEVLAEAEGIFIAPRQERVDGMFFTPFPASRE